MEMGMSPKPRFGGLEVYVVLLSALASVGLSLRVSGQQQPATRPAGPSSANWTDEQKEQYRWEQLIQFFGDEATGTWSLRIHDANASERATFKYLELWKYDLKEKRWVKIDDVAQEAKIVPAAEKPAGSPYPDSQMLAELPVKED